MRGFFQKGAFTFRAVCVSTVLIFTGFIVVADIFRLRVSDAASLDLPEPASMLTVSHAWSAPVLAGLRLNPENPLHIEFIVNPGDVAAIDTEGAQTLIRYFLTALTVPEENIWVNLSPYENDRILPDSLAVTDLGRDLLSQDYLLKQLSSSLTHPDTDTGKAYWQSRQGGEGFSKVWIVPETAKVYEDGGLVMITEARLKVMTQADYFASKRNDANPLETGDQEAIREKIIPSITRDVNEGRNFAALRQIYHAQILATWFKNKLRESLFNSYFDKEKMKGVDTSDPAVREKVFNLYVEAFRKGAYQVVSKERDPQTHQIVKRYYFSGGYFGDVPDEIGSSSVADLKAVFAGSSLQRVSTDLKPVVSSSAIANSQYEADVKWLALEVARKLVADGTVRIDRDTVVKQAAAVVKSKVNGADSKKRFTTDYIERNDGFSLVRRVLPEVRRIHAFENALPKEEIARRYSTLAEKYISYYYRYAERYKGFTSWEEVREYGKMKELALRAGETVAPNETLEQFLALDTMLKRSSESYKVMAEKASRGELTPTRELIITELGGDGQPVLTRVPATDELTMHAAKWDMPTLIHFAMVNDVTAAGHGKTGMVFIDRSDVDRKPLMTPSVDRDPLARKTNEPHEDLVHLTGFEYFDVKADGNGRKKISWKVNVEQILEWQGLNATAEEFTALVEDMVNSLPISDDGESQAFVMRLMNLLGDTWLNYIMGDDHERLNSLAGQKDVLSKLREKTRIFAEVLERHREVFRGLLLEGGAVSSISRFRVRPVSITRTLPGKKHQDFSADNKSYGIEYVSRHGIDAPVSSTGGRKNIRKGFDEPSNMFIPPQTFAALLNLDPQTFEPLTSPSRFAEMYNDKGLTEKPKPTAVAIDETQVLSVFEEVLSRFYTGELFVNEAVVDPVYRRVVDGDRIVPLTVEKNGKFVSEQVYSENGTSVVYRNDHFLTTEPKAAQLLRTLTNSVLSTPQRFDSLQKALAFLRDKSVDSNELHNKLSLDDEQTAEAIETIFYRVGYEVARTLTNDPQSFKALSIGYKMGTDTAGRKIQLRDGSGIGKPIPDLTLGGRSVLFDAAEAFNDGAKFFTTTMLNKKTAEVLAEFDRLAKEELKDKNNVSYSVSYDELKGHFAPLRFVHFDEIFRTINNQAKTRGYRLSFENGVITMSPFADAQTKSVSAGSALGELTAAALESVPDRILRKYLRPDRRMLYDAMFTAESLRMNVPSTEQALAGSILAAARKARIVTKDEAIALIMDVHMRLRKEKGLAFARRFDARMAADDLITTGQGEAIDTVVAMLDDLNNGGPWPTYDALREAVFMAAKLGEGGSDRERTPAGELLSIAIREGIVSSDEAVDLVREVYDRVEADFGRTAADRFGGNMAMDGVVDWVQLQAEQVSSSGVAAHGGIDLNTSDILEAGAGSSSLTWQMPGQLDLDGLTFTIGGIHDTTIEKVLAAAP